MSEMTTAGVDARTLEVTQAQRDAAVNLLDRLEAVVTRQGGHLSHEDQCTLRDARALLELFGRRVVRRTVWVDRVP